MRGWLDPKGWIGSYIWNLNEFGKAVFQNSLPTNPEAGLNALEMNLPTYDADTPIIAGNYVSRALRSMAWNAALFDRCAALLQLLSVYGSLDDLYAQAGVGGDGVGEADVEGPDDLGGLAVAHRWEDMGSMQCN